MTRICKKCQETKDEKDYYPRFITCKRCILDRINSKKRLITANKRALKPVKPIELRECMCCLERKTLDNYQKFRRKCNECIEKNREVFKPVMKNVKKDFKIDINQDKSYAGMFYTCKRCQVNRPTYRFKAYQTNYKAEEYRLNLNLSSCNICNPQVRYRTIAVNNEWVLDTEFYKKAEKQFIYKYDDIEPIPIDNILKQSKTLLEEIKQSKGWLEKHHPYVIASVYVDIYGTMIREKDNMHDNLVEIGRAHV